jgi:hypothetical protein
MKILNDIAWTLNLVLIVFQLKKNKMKIGGETIKNLLKNMRDFILFFSKRHKFKNTPFHTFLFGNGLDVLKFGTIQVTTTTYGI